MAIGRSEDRDTPWNPLMLRHHVLVWDPIRVTHLGQRSCDRTTQAGHMTATDQNHRSCSPLPDGGRPHMDPRFLAGVTVTQCKDGRYFRPDTYLNLNCAVVRDSGISNRICASEG